MNADDDQLPTYRYEDECEGKRRYLSKQAAKQSQKHSRSLGGQKLRIYRCEWCDGWHAGHADTGKWQREVAS